MSASPQPPRFEFYDPHSPIYTSPRFLPPAKIVKCKVSDAIVSHGAYLEESVVENAIIGLRSRIGKGVTIRVGACSALLILDFCCYIRRFHDIHAGSCDSVADGLA